MRKLLPLAFGLFVALTPLFAQQTPAPTYPVEHFVLKYGREHPAAPALTELTTVEVRMARTDDTFAEVPTARATPFKLDGALPAGTKFSESALREIFTGIVNKLNAKGLFGVYVVPNREEIDPQSKEDLRKGEDHSLTLVVWLSEVAQVRTLAKGSRFSADESVDNRKHKPVVARSPLHGLTAAGGPGSLFEKPKLDDYLRRVNRHPGRSVEASISAAEEPGRVVLDYLINENKPWFVYAQVSNSGTSVTDQLRERVGIVQNQVFNHDDVASIDYITSNVSKANAVFGSYSFPVILPDKLRVRGYGSWGDFNATTPPSTLTTVTGPATIPGDKFAGTSYTAAAELIASPWSLWKFAIDFTAGVNFDHVEVNNKTLKQMGQADLLSPYFSMRIERSTEVFSLSASVGYETNFKKNQAAQLVRLGRLDTNDSYDLIKAELNASTYLEPLLFGFKPDNSWKRSTLAHEVSLTVRGQYSLGERRLIPQKESAVGGFFSVRGYPESVVAGDRVYTGSAEYRFHIPRALRPSSVKDPAAAASPVKEEPASTLFGRPFNYRAPRVYSQPDWDLIFRGFFDAGYTEISRGTQASRRPEDRNHTLLGTGFGLELQVLRNVNLRADYGWALEGARTGVDAPSGYIKGQNDVKYGSSRAYFLGTFVW